MLDAYKELKPVVYGENAIKHLYWNTTNSGMPCFLMHWHDRMELLYVISGSLELHTQEGHYTVTSGQLVVIPPRQMHGGFVGKDGVYYHTIMFDVEKFCNETIASGKYLVPICESRINFQRIIENSSIQESMERLLKSLEEKEDINPLLPIGILYEIIGQLYNFCDTIVSNSYKQEHSFTPILEYVNAHYTEKITSKDISSRFGYNETYFCRRFKEITGLTFSKYTQALRMEYAQKLLKRTRDDINIIAWNCGYPDVSYFSNCFKKHFGYSPTQFRNAIED